jgi:hypothetical protein
MPSCPRIVFSSITAILHWTWGMMIVPHVPPSHIRDRARIVSLCDRVITRECDRNKHNTLPAEAHETLEYIHRLWTHPRAWPDLGLPCKAVRIRVSQAIHHSRNGHGNLENIRVETLGANGRRRGARRRYDSLQNFGEPLRYSGRQPNLEREK